MSEILSREVKEVVTAKVRMLEGIKCDVCGKVIPAKKYKYDSNKYFEVTTGHHDWGNDSCESIEYRDICPDCISGYVSDYLKDVDGSEYIEVETEYVCMHEVRE